MAIIEMRHVDLLGMGTDKKKILRLMQKAGCVEISEADAALAEYRFAGAASPEETQTHLTRIRWAIQELGRYAGEKTGMLASMSIPQASEADLDAVAVDEQALFTLVNTLEGYELQRGDQRSAQTRLTARIDQLLPWQALSIPVEQLGNTREAIQLVGTVPERCIAALKATLSDHAVTMVEIGEKQGKTNLWIIAHRTEQEVLSEALKQASFAEMTFTQDSGTVASLIQKAQEELGVIKVGGDALTQHIKDAAPQLPRLKLLYELVAARYEREEAAARLAVTKETFLLTGWIPVHACERMEAEIKAISPDYAIAFRPATDEESPPVKLHNNRFATPFESIVSSFSWPDPRGLDPTLVMAPFFLCFFGMMVSDAGYGIIMAILMPLAIHFLKPKTGLKKMMFILGIGGLATIFWGAMFDTWFGMNIKPMLVDPLNEPLTLVGICLGLGALHLFAGLFVGAYMNFKRGKPLAALYDQFSWFFLIVGIGLMMLPMTAPVGKIMAVVSAAVIALTAGRDKKNWLSRLMGGFGALYGITSWLSDLLSYMRLFGMGLATGVIGMVINRLASLLFGKNIIFTVFGVALLIGGHVFNAIINIIGAYVHASRLQYIEFFSKFYEDGGRPFAPLTHSPRYVTIRDSQPDRASS